MHTIKKITLAALLCAYSLQGFSQTPILNLNYDKWKKEELVEKRVLTDKNVRLEEEGLEDNGIKLIEDSLEILQQEQKLYSLSMSSESSNTMFNSRTLTSYIYQQGTFDALRSFAIQTLGDNTYINADFFSFIFGPVRLGIKGSFTPSDDETENEAIKTNLQKLVSNGGNINFDFTMPLIFLRSEDDKVHFLTAAQTIWGINPNIEANTGRTIYASDNITFSNQTGAQMQFSIGSNDGKARLSLLAAYHYTWGNTLQELDLPDFSVLRLQTGIVIQDVVGIFVAGPLFSTAEKVQRTPFTLNLQFSPSELAEKL